MKQRFLILFLAIIAQNLFAQDSLKTKCSIAADVSPYAFSGGSIKLGILPKKKPRTEFALEGFSMTIPNTVVNLNAKNSNLGWEERVNLGVAFYADKKLGAGKSGLWAGLGVVHLNQTVVQNRTTFHYQQLEYIARLNYKWFPFTHSRFYINPYVALAGRHKIGGDNGAYALTPFLIIPSVYLSWEI